MKWLLAMLSKGKNVSEFFPDVVKNVVVKSIEVKKMVYRYLVHYADYDSMCREIALLSINSFQQDMNGANQLIRGLALRVMTSIRVPDIIQIQLLAARKCAADSSPYVRKCAAVSLVKIFNMDAEQLPQLVLILSTLMKDSSTMVLGGAVASFSEICPTRYDVIHRSYRKLCHLLADMDEWTQICALDVLTRYCRNQFADPAPGVADACRLRAKQRSASAVKGHITNTITRKVIKKAFYSDEEDEEAEEEVVVKNDDSSSYFSSTGGANPNPKGISDAAEGDSLDPDHRLLLRSSLPLLKSRNSGVVLGVCQLHYYCGQMLDATSQQIGKALVRILRNRREIQYVVLTCINTIAQENPALFRPFLSDFFIKSTDPVFNKLLKLEILTSVCTKDNIEAILRELQIYIKHSNTSFVSATIKALGRVADAEPAVASKCMEGIMLILLCHKSSDVIGESVNTLRLLLQQNIETDISAKILHQLAKMIMTPKKIEVSLARQSIVWLIGEFYEVLAAASPDILRVLAVGFVDESTETKMQILNYAIKLALRLSDDGNVQNLMTYVLEMARYDVDTDLRDRSRFMTALMGLAPADNGDGGPAVTVDEDALEELSEHARGIMLAPKLPPVTLLGFADIDGKPNFNIGSLSSLVGHHVAGYEPLAGWPSVLPDATVRDALRYAAEDAQAAQSQSSGGWPQQTNRKGDNDSSDDDDNAADRITAGFYGEKSDTESDSSSSSSDSDSGSDSDDDNDDDDDDDSEEESEDAGSQGSSSDSSESDDMEIASSRTPLQSKAASSGVSRQAVRKVASGRVGKKSVFSDDLDDLIGSSAPAAKYDFSGSHHLSSETFDLSDSLASLESAFSNQTLVPEASTQNRTNDILSAFDSGPSQLLGMSALDALASPDRVMKPMGIDFGGAMPAYGGGALEVMSGGPARAAPLATTPEQLSHPKTILKPDMGGGLSVSLVVRYSAQPTVYSGSACVYINIKNTRSDFALRRVKLGFPMDLRRTPVDELPLLAPGQEVVVPCEMALQPFVGKQVKVDVRSDQGAYTGTLSPEMHELLSPLRLSPADFSAAKKKIGGFNEVTRMVPVASLSGAQAAHKSDVSLVEELVISGVRQLVNVHVCQGSGTGELLFAGSFRKGAVDEKVLIDASCSLEQVTFRFTCEDAMLPTALSDLFKKDFTK